MTNKIDQYVKETYRYFYEDGLVEMAVGLLFISVAIVLLFTWQNMGSSPFITVMLVVGLPVLIIGGTVLVRRLVHNLKERVTYKRTGFVSYRREEPSRNRWLLLVAVLLLLAASIFLPEAFSRMHFFVGALLAIVLCFLGYRLNLWRFYVLGLAALLLGVTTALWTADEYLGTALVFAGSGLVLLLSGGLALADYIHQHPQPGRTQS